MTAIRSNPSEAHVHRHVHVIVIEPRHLRPLGGSWLGYGPAFTSHLYAQGGTVL
jgi:hypothetical protein